MNHAMAETIATRLGMDVVAYEAKIAARAWTFGATEALRVGAIDGLVAPRDLPPVAP